MVTLSPLHVHTSPAATATTTTTSSSSSSATPTTLRVRVRVRAAQLVASLGFAALLRARRSSSLGGAPSRARWHARRSLGFELEGLLVAAAAAAAAAVVVVGGDGAAGRSEGVRFADGGGGWSVGFCSYS